MRFPFRAELMDDPMVDDQLFTRVEDRPFIAVAEVKRGACAINGPWRYPERQNLQRVLRAIGLFPAEEIDPIAKMIYQDGICDYPCYYFSLITLGSEPSHDLARSYPRVPQLTWDYVLQFVHQRFDEYFNQKGDHPQWDGAGQWLWNRFKRFRRDPDGFVNDVIGRFPAR